MNWLRTRIARQPKGAMVLGKALFLAGGILVLAALFARIRLVALNTERAATQLPPLQTLAEAFALAPTWMVPRRGRSATAWPRRWSWRAWA